MTTAQNVLDKVEELSSGLGQLTKDAEAATLEALLARPKTTYIQSLFLDPINGDDLKDARSTGTAVKKLSALLKLVPPGTSVIIYLLDDYLLDEQILMLSPPAFIRFQGIDAATNGQKRVKFSRAENYIQWQGHLSVLFLNVEIDVGGHTLDHAGIFWAGAAATLSLEMISTEIKSTGRGKLLFTSSPAALSFVAVTIDPSASGNLIHGVAAGDDPNSKFGITANFTSA